MAGEGGQQAQQLAAGQASVAGVGAAQPGGPMAATVGVGAMGGAVQTVQPGTPTDDTFMGIERYKINAIFSIIDALALAGVGDGTNPVVKKLVTKLGATVQTAPVAAVIASATQEEDEAEVLTGLVDVQGEGETLTEVPAGMLFKSKVRLARTLCVEKCRPPSVNSDRPPTAELAAVQTQMAAIASTLASVQSAPREQPMPSSVGIRKLKLKETVDQMSEEECEVLSDAQIAKCWAHYETLMGEGEKPEKGEEPTNEQLSAINHMLQMGLLPYVDFLYLRAVWDPHDQASEASGNSFELGRRDC